MAIGDYIDEGEWMYHLQDRKEGNACYECGTGVYKKSKKGNLYCSNLCWID